MTAIYNSIYDERSFHTIAVSQRLRPDRLCVNYLEEDMLSNSFIKTAIKFGS